MHTLWAHEALDFTPCLAKLLGILGEGGHAITGGLR